MTKVHTARIDHGPCDSCGKPITAGQSYRAARGRCLPGEEPTRTKTGDIYTGGLHYTEKVIVKLPGGGTVTTWVHVGFVTFKRHDGCPYPEKRK